MDKKQQTALTQFVSQLSQKQLQDFAVSAAQITPSLYYELTAQSGKLDFETEFNDIKQTIKTTIKKHVNDEGLWSNSTVIVVNELLLADLQRFTRRGQQGYYAYAFHGILFVLLNAGKIQSTILPFDDTFKTTINTALKKLTALVQQIKDQVNASTKQNMIQETLKIFNRKIWDGKEKTRYKIISSIIPLIPESMLTIVTQTMTNSIARISDGGYDGYIGNDLPDAQAMEIIIKARLKYHFGKADQARALLDKNLDDPNVRLERVKFALNDKDYELAAKLCQEGDWRNMSWKDIWQKQLIQIYSTTHQDQDLEKILRRRLLTNNTDAYQPLKQLYIRQNKWQRIRSDLLKDCQQQLTTENNAFVLNIEHEYAKLLAVIADTSYLIYQYTPVLYQQFPEEISHSYYDYLISNDHYANKAAYKRVGDKLIYFAKVANPHQALTWISWLQKKYPYRSAMQEQLMSTRDNIQEIIEEAKQTPS